SGDDELGELRGKEELEPPEALELRHLLLYPRLQRAVGLGELIVQLLDAQQRPHTREQPGLMDRLREEVVRARLEPLDALLTWIEGRDQDHRQHHSGAIAAEFAAHLVAAHLRHDDVEAARGRAARSPPAPAPRVRRWRSRPHSLSSPAGRRAA